MSDKEKREKCGGDRKTAFRVSWNCAAELLLLLVTIFLLFFFVIILLHFTFSPTNLSSCLPRPLSVSASLSSPATAVPQPETETGNGVVKRGFNGFGSAAYNFILMSAYRGGYDTFAVMGLASKPLHVFGQPSFVCEWVPAEGGSVSVAGMKILPDWGYGRVYTAVVINCTFPVSVGETGVGGKLLIHAATNGGGDTGLNVTDTFTAMTEKPEDFARFVSGFSSEPRYDYLYCGSPLFGNLSPQRIREWLAYHVRFFGKKAHFVIQDAGGVHPAVMEVLRPWMELGYVTLQDIREEERFDGFYHNQFLVLNDCLHKYRFSAKWMFFFDVDEFIFVPKKSSLPAVLRSLSEYTQFTIEQMPMSAKLCLREDSGKASRRWGFEKLVYKDVKTGIWRDRKYAVQPRNVIATGIHMSENTTAGSKTTHQTEGRIMYYHYHGAIAQRNEPCRQFVNATSLTVDDVPYLLDTTMRRIAQFVKKFELETIGNVLQNTHQ
ncbi:unnamed protein product [Cuscuta epithymum]|uniref:Glycosyltransferase family 92 protein n=1 Tax=Cuscuta epithymum TaxID=186058 RepID=A0AAV0D3R8_9ASTE|nr:unnamed protein product [Cuscuta epithymum]